MTEWMNECKKNLSNPILFFGPFPGSQVELPAPQSEYDDDTLEMMSRQAMQISNQVLEQYTALENVIFFKIKNKNKKQKTKNKNTCID